MNTPGKPSESYLNLKLRLRAENKDVNLQLRGIIIKAYDNASYNNRVRMPCDCQLASIHS